MSWSSSPHSSSSAASSPASPATPGAGSPPPRPPAPPTSHPSPDGGIYRTPVHLDVLMAARRSVTALAQRLGTTQAWRPLQPLGDFTLVAVRMRNDGKAWSEPDVRDLQIA